MNSAFAAAHFADWSNSAASDAAEAKRREKSLRDIAALVNRLDFQEREKNREKRTGEEFFRLLSPSEKSLFIKLTVAESMNSLMKSLDAMKPEQRKKFVEQGLKEIQNGRTKDDMARTDAMNETMQGLCGNEFGPRH